MVVKAESVSTPLEVEDRVILTDDPYSPHKSVERLTFSPYIEITFYKPP